MRRVIRYGLIGIAPGALVIVTAVVLHTLGVITADESQIGFIGIPVMFLGLLAGVLSAAMVEELVGGVMAGMGLGVVAGIVLGAALVSVLPAAWLVTAPCGILGGAVFGARRAEHRRPHAGPSTQS